MAAVSVLAFWTTQESAPSSINSDVKSISLQVQVFLAARFFWFFDQLSSIFFIDSM